MNIFERNRQKVRDAEEKATGTPGSQTPEKAPPGPASQAADTFSWSKAPSAEEKRAKQRALAEMLRQRD